MIAKSILSTYNDWYEDAEEEYLLALFYPESWYPTRYPRILPLPTHVYTERLTVMYTPSSTNSTGNVWI